MHCGRYGPRSSVASESVLYAAPIWTNFQTQNLIEENNVKLALNNNIDYNKLNVC